MQIGRELYFTSLMLCDRVRVAFGTPTLCLPLFGAASFVRCVTWQGRGGKRAWLLICASTHQFRWEGKRCDRACAIGFDCDSKIPLSLGLGGLLSVGASGHRVQRDEDAAVEYEIHPPFLSLSLFSFFLLRAHIHKRCIPIGQ